MNTGKRRTSGVLALIGGLAGGILGAFIFTTLNAPTHVAKTTLSRQVVKVQNLEIVDPNGKLRAQLNVSRDGLVRMSFFSPHGKRRLAMGVLGDGEPALGMYDTLGNPRIGLNVPLDDSAGVRLVDAKGVPRMSINELEDGKTTIRVMDKNGNIVWSAAHHGERARALSRFKTAPATLP